jgi:hydrogenase maturation protein HypF
MTQRLQQHGKMVLTPCLYPINDGGVSLGQAVIAAAISEKNYIEFL